jgi:outer membrane protein
MSKLNGKSLLLALVAFASAGASAASIKVGTVDLQRALQESKRGKSSNAAFEKEMKDKDTKLKSEQESIRKAVEDFQKKGAVLSEKARNEQQAKLQQRMAGLEEMRQKFAMEFQTRQGELVKPLIDGLRNLVPDIARRRNLELVMEASQGGLLFALDKTDITDELIKLYDEKNP